MRVDDGTANGAPLPVNVRPPPGLSELTGSDVMARLATAVREAVKARRDVLRFECATECGLGFACMHATR